MHKIAEFIRALFAPIPNNNSPFDYHTEVGMMFFSALGGAVLGALIGGLTQYLISSKERKDATADRHLEQTERQRAQAFSCFIKASTIANQLAIIRANWNKGIQDIAEAKGSYELPLWLTVPPISGLPQEAVQFSIEDISLLFSLKLTELANELAIMNEVYRTFIHGVNEHSRARIEIADIAPAEFIEHFDFSALSEEQQAALRPKIHRLEYMTKSIGARFESDIDNSVKLAVAMSSAFRERFGADAFPKAIDKERRPVQS